MRGRRRPAAGLLGIVVLLLVALVCAGADPEQTWERRRKGDLITPVHEEGRCAVRGHCGKQSFFGSQLNCPDNGKAREPESAIREKVVETCGAEWSEGAVCCDMDQLNDLSKNLKRAESLIASCPACKKNFFDLFCQFTCSPDQSQFVNVTKTEKATNGNEVVTELNYFVNPTFASGFYDSCKDVKFSATNGYVMDLIGGGAKNYTEFLKFLGDKKMLGSPFQINFPEKSKLGEDMVEMHEKPKKCNDDDAAYRCACVDCPDACPVLPDVDDIKECKVGVIPCWSFSVLIIYAVFLVALAGAWSFIGCKNGRIRGSHEARPIIQAIDASDDEDESYVATTGTMDYPRKTYFINTQLDRMFTGLGQSFASYPSVTVVTSIIVVGLLSLGWMNFSIETDPVRLWVAPTSETAQEKAFFDENFGPFYRTQQVFLVNETTEDADVLSHDVLHWWFDVEQRIRRLKSWDHQVTLEQVCLNPTGAGCVVQSVSGYFQQDFRNVGPDWKDHLLQCAETAVATECMPDFGQPLNPDLVLGGWQETGKVTDAKAMIITWVLTNHAEGSKEEIISMDWERTLKNVLLSVKEEAREKGLRMSFSTEISLEEELNKSTNTDAKIIVISYIAMFIYASLALGSSSAMLRDIMVRPSRALVDSKVTLGLIGIIIVLMSVSASVGFFSFFHIPVTLIIAEVIPFLVLAVGVDNIFLIVHEFERANFAHPDEEIDVRIGKAIGRIGPSILLSATSETVAFALGSAVGMPAVRNFAIYAAGAVFINAVLQVTMFVAVLALNQRRVEGGRMDCFPCLKIDRSQSNGHARSESDSLMGNENAALGYGEEEGVLQKLIRKKYAPNLLLPQVKAGVMVVFIGIFAAGLALLPEVELGLDQRIALPSDSYLIKYFDDMYDYFSVGPPVYFVTKDLNITSRAAQQSLCGRFTTCDSLSLANVLEQERKRPEVSYIADPAASWIDDYLLWLNPTLETCCRVRKDNQSKLCTEDDPSRACKVCFEDRVPAWNITLAGMPEGQEFLNYFDIWVDAPTGEDCPIAGRAAYSTAIVADHEKLTVPASHFRTSHTPLRSQADFIAAYASARRIANDISANTGATVFPYSKFYIFFDQYASIARLTTGLMAAALAAIFIITAFLLGSLRTALVVTVTVLMIVVDILGVMALWGVSLNAVSLVNLIICVGIGVEFCSHIARAFTFPSRSVVDRARLVTLGKNRKRYLRGKDAWAWAALVNVGGTVLSGITITKLIGVIVLAFTRSKIFEIYYFRVWLALVVIASTHALIFLPVALSWAGGEGWRNEGEGGLEENLARRAVYRRQRVPAEYEDDDSDEE